MSTHGKPWENRCRFSKRTGSWAEDNRVSWKVPQKTSRFGKKTMDHFLDVEVLKKKQHEGCGTAKKILSPKTSVIPIAWRPPSVLVWCRATIALVSAWRSVDLRSLDIYLNWKRTKNRSYYDGMHLNNSILIGMAQYDAIMYAIRCLSSWGPCDFATNTRCQCVFRCQANKIYGVRRVVPCQGPCHLPSTQTNEYTTRKSIRHSQNYDGEDGDDAFQSSIWAN